MVCLKHITRTTTITHCVRSDAQTARARFVGVMCMTKIEAIKKIEKALETEQARVIPPKDMSYQEHILKLSELLMNQTIEPIRVKVTSTIIKDADFEKYKNTKVWAIAKSNDNWLLTLEGIQEFALGFGVNPKSIMMHGCSSSDVLGEWCA